MGEDNVRWPPDVITIDHIIDSEKIKLWMFSYKAHLPSFTGEGENLIGFTPPIVRKMILIEGGVPEQYVQSWLNDVFAATGGLQLEAIKLNERYAFSEVSQMHGAMLQKISYQKNAAKDLLATIQNVKTAILNIESDLEKMGEQKKAFEDNDWEQIKAIFVDNYGGPTRSWTAIARALPFARMALTWFLRLKVPEKVPFAEYFREKDPEKREKIKEKISEAVKKNKEAMLKRIDELVEQEQMNPALGAFIKRKLEEFWNWVENYGYWIFRTYKRIKENLIQQKANLKLYMKWAAESIVAVKRMSLDMGELEKWMPEAFAKYTPRAVVVMEYLLHAKKRADIYEHTKPWVPVILTRFIMTYNPDIQKWKFVVMAIDSYFGVMLDHDLDEIINIAMQHETAKGYNLLKIMVEEGFITKEELEEIFEPDELKELGYPFWEKKEKKKKSLDVLVENLKIALNNFLALFGLELPEGGVLGEVKRRRAEAIAQQLMIDGIKMFKKANGMLVIE